MQLYSLGFPMSIENCINQKFCSFRSSKLVRSPISASGHYFFIACPVTVERSSIGRSIRESVAAVSRDIDRRGRCRAGRRRRGTPKGAAKPIAWFRIKHLSRKTLKPIRTIRHFPFQTSTGGGRIGRSASKNLYGVRFPKVQVSSKQKRKSQSRFCGYQTHTSFHFSKLF
jgi:hypothetical protein